jgi:hypothetical protein
VKRGRGVLVPSPVSGSTRFAGMGNGATPDKKRAGINLPALGVAF